MKNKIIASRLENIAAEFVKHDPLKEIVLRIGEHRLTVLDLITAAKIIDSTIPRCTDKPVKQAPQPIRLRCPSCNDMPRPADPKCKFCNDTGIIYAVNTKTNKKYPSKCAHCNRDHQSN